MWRLDPIERPNYEDILQHEWFTCDVTPSEKEIIKEFNVEYRKLIADNLWINIMTEKAEGKRLYEGL